VARPYDVAISGFYAGVVHGLIGEVPEALAALRSAFAVCSQHQIDFLVPVVAAGLGYTEALAGDAEAAMGLLDRAAQGSRSAGMPYLGAWASTYLAQAKLLQGDADAALEAATRALETTRRHGLRGVEPVAMRAQALASARQAGARGLDAAVATLYAALERATGLALRPEEAHCHADLARLHRTRGEAEHAERAQLHALGL
jgi:tetratricopeptide (TPR) repeat protein